MLDYITTLIKQHKNPTEVMNEVVGILDSDSKMFVSAVCVYVSNYMSLYVCTCMYE